MSAESVKPLVFVTGLSGAGMSSALSALEDLGYETVDNPPVDLVADILKGREDTRPLAVALDSRTRGFSAAAVVDLAARLKAALVFITCDEEVLQKRFSETRRRHPLAKDRPVADGIRKEQRELFPLREAANLVLDTTEWTIHDLRRAMTGHFSAEPGGSLTVSVISFGYKYGLPREADMIVDVRFLKNPHWVTKLRPLTGRDKAVAAHIEEDEGLKDFLKNLETLLQPLLPRYAAEGKSYLTIAVGCSGGRHRSVYIAERLLIWLERQKCRVHLQHRDMDRGTTALSAETAKP